ncbi:ABC transporter ATP-binding protein, partial [Halolamina litorea]
EAVEVFRETLRARDRTERSLSERARELLGFETRFATVDEVVEELFADRELPGSIREPVDHATELARNGDEADALEHLKAELGSVCDHESPGAHGVDAAGRESRCHRHEAEYADPSAVGPSVGED